MVQHWHKKYLQSNIAWVWQGVLQVIMPTTLVLEHVAPSSPDLPCNSHEAEKKRYYTSRNGPKRNPVENIVEVFHWCSAIQNVIRVKCVNIDENQHNCGAGEKNHPPLDCENESCPTSRFDFAETIPYELATFATGLRSPNKTPEAQQY